MIFMGCGRKINISVMAWRSVSDVKNTGQIQNARTAIYDEEENNIWRKERQKDCLFQDGILCVMAALKGPLWPER